MIALILTCLLFVSVLGACSNSNGSSNQDTSNGSNTGNTDTTQSDSNLRGTITMAGSTSMEKLANAAAEAFMTKYPGVQMSPEFIGSTAGIQALTAKTVEIGNASRSLTDAEKAAGVVENVVAIDGIAIISDKSNTVASLTKDQLTQIYTGAITNWSAVGGADQPIVVVGREAGSGTRGAFEELLGIADKCKYSNEINSTGGVMAKVASIPGAIGYVSLDVLDDTIISIKVDNVAPTEENIKSGSYLLSRPFVMATYGDIDSQDKLVKAFFDFLKSDEGKKLITDVGLILPD